MHLTPRAGIYYRKSRDDTTRTCDPLVPNQVYYQLYYIPIFKCSKEFPSQKQCKGTAFI